ncbi:PREDICTED: uncharacterized protein LOC106819566 [Priapulus caudatus]|uniref:Uncharacterized protein LOC106819566 n=1 Tax=Priapulus caudatus TaxID=37621 RepID=A0ABM1F5E5_PRICU|nr:PREDICTED: uncharacterized protein LOC106819566 [Priapulus caudatus]XP_014679664.1 PREDICTED: uncharacterized protein LOC106819566 [Priapulus caudatus]XP_014679665.1 PREDICTED: uncharacterized protein LOC106819566 [Priapulus caudatus]XP_014679666.1 PREDICTED: uncharacterized protein LOC106819566 [Priapulus caudatus]
MKIVKGELQKALNVIMPVIVGNYQWMLWVADTVRRTVRHVDSLDSSNLQRKKTMLANKRRCQLADLPVGQHLQDHPGLIYPEFWIENPVTITADIINSWQATIQYGIFRKVFESLQLSRAQDSSSFDVEYAC